MDHEAIGKHAAERYILAEMSEAERDAFEEHYFGCLICAEDVKALDAIREGLREQSFAVSSNDQPAPVLPFRRKMLPLVIPWATAATLLLGVGYDRLVRIPRLVAQIPPAVQLAQNDLYLRSETRAEAEVKPFHANVPGTIYIDIDAQPEYVSYRYEVRRGATVLGEGPIPTARLSDSVPLQVRSLPAGRYEVVIEGVRKEGNRTEITRHAFDVVEVAPGVRAEQAP
ncbi:MAG TPA: hypothetical protein VGF48_19430 [Thermoanaerobaculia bacterium]|jgi:hypothetical protein